LFFYAIPTWLASNNVSTVLIGGYVAATALPWTLKFVNGFIMDRFTYLPMGKRRAWLIGAQLIMFVGCLGGALINPSYSDVAVLTTISVMINTATTFQDVAVDGLAVDLIRDEERPRANGLMFGGQAVGIALGTTISGVLFSSFGAVAAFLCMSGLILMALSLVLVSRERPGERLLPWTQGDVSREAKAQKAEAWLPLLRSVWGAMLNRNSILLGVAMIMNGVIFGLYLTVGPVIATGPGGWSNEGFASLTGMASLTAGLAGVLVFGFLVNRIGTRIGGTSGLLLYGLLGLVTVLLQPYWSLSWVVMIFAFGAFCTDIYIKVSTCSTAMRLCDIKVGATQFTLYMALANLGITISGFITGPLDGVGGNIALLLAITAAGFIGAGAFALIPGKAEAPVGVVPAVD
jgi:PAT family beta-lactamase induction signal transducer AmpG